MERDITPISIEEEEPLEESKHHEGGSPDEMKLPPINKDAFKDRDEDDKSPAFTPEEEQYALDFLKLFVSMNEASMVDQVNSLIVIKSIPGPVKEY